MRKLILRSIAAWALWGGLLVPLCADAQNLTGVVSRKMHGAAGTFDLPISTAAPIGGTVTVDPRAIGSGHLIVFQFDTAITSTGTVSVVDSAMNPIGMAMATFAGNEVLVSVTGIPDNTRLTVSLTGVNGAVNTSVSMGFLLGDVSGNRTVDSQDATIVRNRTGTAATAGAFLQDLGTTGMTTGADVAVAKRNSGNFLVAAGQAALQTGMGGTGIGTISSMPAGISCPGTCIGSYPLNSMVTLTAAPGVGSTFGGWSGLCTGMSAGVSVMLATSANCTAMFVANIYNVTPSAGANGSITPASVQMANHGTQLQFTVTPNANYGSVVGGTCGGTLTGNSYLTNPITAPCTVSATFNALNFSVTPSAGPDGVINPNTVQSVAPGATKVFTVTPNGNFQASVGGTCGGTLNGFMYTTAPVNAACTVVATFTRIMYNVTPSAGANGTISPNTVQSVASGNTIQFNVTPSPGYTAAVSGSCPGSLSGNVYTAGPITGICSVNATFSTNKTYYVATNGNDTTGTGTSAAPYKTIQKGISKLAAGDTLIVKNGVYTGSANFIVGMPSGSATSETKILAETPMEVRINSTADLDYEENMLSIGGAGSPRNKVRVDGFIFDMANTSYPEKIAHIEGSYNTVMRSIFKRSGDIDSYGGLFAVYGTDNLFEDLAGVGACRYCFVQGSTDEVAQRNIWRRIVGRVDYSNSEQPKATFATYGNDSIQGNKVYDHLYQNVIALDGRRPTNNGGEERYGSFYFIKASTGIRVQGSIVLNEGAAYSGMHLVDYGSSNVNTVTNSVVWDQTGSDSSARGVKAYSVDHMTIGGVPSRTPTNLTTGTATASLLNPSTKPANLLNNTPGAVIMKRYGVSGTRWGEPGYDQLTTEDLWPWPYQDKIKAIFREVNNVPAGNTPGGTNNTLRGFAADGTGLYGGPITLTSYIWEYLGTPCPPTICF